MKLITIEDLAKFLGKSTEELLKLAKKEDGTDKSESELSKSVTELLNGKVASVKTEAADNSIKNRMEKLEKVLASKFGLESGIKFDDAILELETRLTDLKKAAEGKGGEADKELEGKYKTAQAKIKEMEDAIRNEKANASKIQSNYEQARLLDKVAKSSLLTAQKNGLKLPADIEAAEEIISALVHKKLNGRTLKEENGKIYYLDADGNIVKDSSYNTLEVLTDVTSNLPNYFPKGDSVTGGSNPPPKNQDGTGGNFVFSEDHLSPAGYMAKYTELKAQGKKDEAAALTKQFQEKSAKV